MSEVECNCGDGHCILGDFADCDNCPACGPAREGLAAAIQAYGEGVSVREMEARVSEAKTRKVAEQHARGLR
jgi:hypothetical protein